MKNVVRLANVLSWINLVCWGLVCAYGLLMALASGFFLMIVVVFFISSIVLHSYAAIQLNKSLRDPARPLGRNTPAGIRFIGFAALFFGILYMAYASAILQHPQDVMKMFQEAMKGTAVQVTVKAARALGIFILLMGLSVSLNVILNFRLLRWYYLMKENEPKP